MTSHLSKKLKVFCRDSKLKVIENAVKNPEYAPIELGKFLIKKII